MIINLREPHKIKVPYKRVYYFTCKPTLTLQN